MDISILENGKTTQQSPGDLKRLAVTLTPMKYHQLTLVWKTHEKWYYPQVFMWFQVTIYFWYKWFAYNTLGPIPGWVMSKTQ